MENLDRFLNYVKINTQADDTTGTTPSTEHQKNLGNLLVQELLELGLSDAHMDEWGNVYGHLPGGPRKVGLNAHMDTALEVTDEGVNPQIIKQYDGGIITYLNGLTMSPKEFPSLKKHMGHDLVITDGNTLLGGDDKAGIAIIMSALQFFHDNPQIKHDTLCVCFTVDEEIGEGPLHFNYQKMDADFAYTLDGADIDMIEDQNFNAYSADITVKGVSIHPGEGKNKLINAILVLNDIINQLPKKETPYDSDGLEGFFHVTSLAGTSEEMKCHIIIRDFDKENIIKRLSVLTKAIESTQEKYPDAEILYNYKSQYENMRIYVDEKPEVVENAKKALLVNGITPIMGAIRGGTDGATFSKNGLITPNLGTGSYNHHGRFEYLDVQEFETMIKIVISLVS